MASESESLYVCVPGTQSEIDMISYYRYILGLQVHYLVHAKRGDRYLSVEDYLSLSGREAMDGGVYRCLTQSFISLLVLLTLNFIIAAGK